MKRSLASLPIVLFTGFAVAGPADYIYTPAVQYGEREIDFKYGKASSVNGNGAFGANAGFGYGATEHWFTEVYLKREREDGGYSTMTEWENKFQLTETGEYPVDVGFITELEAPLSGNAPYELRLGPLLQTEFRRLQLNGNLLLERAIGDADENGAPYTTNLDYQWQVKYRWKPAFDFGLQGFGEVGQWNHWNSPDNQNHRIGPAFMGKLALGGQQTLVYNAAWLFGVSKTAPNHIFRMQVEYEF